MKRIIYLARHGETDWNRAGRWQGHTDIPLNQAGRAQALALGERVRGLGISHVHASDLSRARETAEIAARALDARFAGTDPGLRERNFGVFEGLTRAEVEARYPDLWAAYSSEQRIRPPGSELHGEVRSRMTASLLRIAQAAATTEAAALVISHGGSIRVALSDITGRLIPPLENGALFRVTIVGQEFVDVSAL